MQNQIDEAMKDGKQLKNLEHPLVSGIGPDGQQLPIKGYALTLNEKNRAGETEVIVVANYFEVNRAGGITFFHQAPSNPVTLRACRAFAPLTWTDVTPIYDEELLNTWMGTSTRTRTEVPAGSGAGSGQHQGGSTSRS